MSEQTKNPVPPPVDKYAEVRRDIAASTACASRWTRAAAADRCVSHAASLLKDIAALEAVVAKLRIALERICKEDYEPVGESWTVGASIVAAAALAAAAGEKVEGA